MGWGEVRRLLFYLPLRITISKQSAQTICTPCHTSPTTTTPGRETTAIEIYLWPRDLLITANYCAPGLGFSGQSFIQWRPFLHYYRHNLSLTPIAAWWTLNGGAIPYPTSVHRSMETLWAFFVRLSVSHPVISICGQIRRDGIHANEDIRIRRVPVCLSLSTFCPVAL